MHLHAQRTHTHQHLEPHHHPYSRIRAHARDPMRRSISAPCVRSFLPPKTFSQHTDTSGIHEYRHTRPSLYPRLGPLDSFPHNPPSTIHPCHHQLIRSCIQPHPCTFPRGAHFVITSGVLERVEQIRRSPLSLRSAAHISVKVARYCSVLGSKNCELAPS